MQHQCTRTNWSADNLKTQPQSVDITSHGAQVSPTPQISPLFFSFPFGVTMDTEAVCQSS